MKKEDYQQPMDIEDCDVIAASVVGFMCVAMLMAAGWVF